MNLIEGSVAAFSIAFTALRIPSGFAELKLRLCKAAIASSCPSSVTGLLKSTFRIAFAGTAGSSSAPRAAMPPIIPKNSIELMNIAISVPTITASVVLRKFFMVILIIML